MNLTKDIKELEDSAVELTITIPKKEVSNSYQELLAKYAKTAQIPGFRKGHVPASILERKFGESIKIEAAADLIEKALDDTFKKGDVKQPLPYMQPQLDKMPDVVIGKDLKFTVKYDVMPEVSVKEFSGITVAVPQVSVGDAEIQEELKAVQERNAMVIDRKDDDAAEKDNIATIDYCELAEDGSVLEGSKREDFVFTIGSGQNIYELDDDIIGMKKGETKDVTKKYKKTHTNTELAGTTKKIRVTLKALKVRNLPELDDELAQDVNEKFKTLDDLKADIKRSLESALENKLKEIKSNSLVEQLVEKNPITLPKTMVQVELESRWRMMAQQFQTTPEQLEKLFGSSGKTKADIIKEWEPDAVKALKARLIVDNLLKENNITITPEEVENEYKSMAEKAGITVEEVKKHYDDPRNKEYLIDDMKEQKLYASLFEKVKITKGEKKSFSDLFKNQA